MVPGTERCSTNICRVGELISDSTNIFCVPSSEPGAERTEGLSPLVGLHFSGRETIGRMNFKTVIEGNPQPHHQEITSVINFTKDCYRNRMREGLLGQ